MWVLETVECFAVFFSPIVYSIINVMIKIATFNLNREIRVSYIIIIIIATVLFHVCTAKLEW